MVAKNVVCATSSAAQLNVDVRTPAVPVSRSTRAHAKETSKATARQRGDAQALSTTDAPSTADAPHASDQTPATSATPSRPDGALPSMAPGELLNAEHAHTPPPGEKDSRKDSLEANKVHDQMDMDDHLALIALIDKQLDEATCESNVQESVELKVCHLLDSFSNILPVHPRLY